MGHCDNNQNCQNRHLSKMEYESEVYKILFDEFEKIYGPPKTVRPISEVMGYSQDLPLRDRLDDFPVFENTNRLYGDQSTLDRFRQNDRDRFMRGNISIMQNDGNNFPFHDSSAGPEVEILRNEIRMLMQNISDLKGDNSRLQMMMERYDGSDNQNITMKCLQETIGKLEDENYNLSRKLNTLENSDLHLNELKVKCNSLERENSSLNDSIKSLKESNEKTIIEKTRLEVKLQDAMAELQNAREHKNLNLFLADQVIIY